MATLYDAAQLLHAFEAAFNAGAVFGFLLGLAVAAMAYLFFDFRHQAKPHRTESGIHQE